MGGGLAMLTGLDEFPRSWLRRTPFGDCRVNLVTWILAEMRLTSRR